MCAAWWAECHKCGKKGHYAVVCRTLQVSDVFNTETEQGEAETFFLGSVTVQDSSHGQ